MVDNNLQKRLAVLIDADNASPKIIIGLLEEIATYGIASVKRIVSTPVPGGGGGSAGVSAGALAPPAPVARDIGVSPELVAEQQSVRAYVVSGDVTTSQEAEAKLNAKRTLGS